MPVPLPDAGATFPPRGIAVIAKSARALPASRVGSAPRDRPHGGGIGRLNAHRVRRPTHLDDGAGQPSDARDLHLDDVSDRETPEFAGAPVRTTSPGRNVT